MMRPVMPFALAALLLAACSSQPAGAAQEGAGAERAGLEGREDVTPVRESDPEMNAAIAAARRTLPEFLAVVDKPPRGVTNVVFKFPLGGWEHIWVSEVRHVGNTLTGRLSNTPVQEGYGLGDRVTVPLREVSDWAYRDARGVMQGHRTTRVLLPRLDPGEAAEIARSMGWKD